MRYIQQDWQGSVRTITNANGFVVSRTDHQAFGGEVGYGTGQRTIDQGYNRDAATRQGYGLTERDDASGLDHTWFRKNESSAGRWTSPDPYKGSMSLADPQSFNRFSYVENQPTNFVDPSGLDGVAEATALAQQLLQSKACQKAVGGKVNSNLSAQLGKIYSQGRMTLRSTILRAKIVNGKLTQFTAPFPSQAAGLTSWYAKPGSKTLIPYHISLNQNQAPWNTQSNSMWGGWESSPGTSVGLMTNLESQAQNVLHEFRHWLGDRGGSDHDRKFNAEIYTFCFLLNPSGRDKDPAQAEPVIPGGEITPQPLETSPTNPVSYNNSDWGFWMLHMLYAMHEAEVAAQEGSVTVCYNGQCY